MEGPKNVFKKLRVYAQVLETRAREFLCVYGATRRTKIWSSALAAPSHLVRWSLVSRRSFLSDSASNNTKLSI